MRFSRFKSWVVGLCVLALVGCGGGGGAGSSVLPGDGAGTPILGGSVPKAGNLILTLSAASLPNNGSQTVVATAIALDANNNTLAGVPVTISADSGVVTPSGTTTSGSGQLTATVGIGANQANRTITITAISGSLTKTAQLAVVDSAGGGGSGTTASDLLLNLSAATIANSGAQTITATATALDAKRNVLSGVVVSFSVDQGGTVAPTGTSTNDSGVLTARVGIGSLTTNRTITVTATADGITKTLPLQVVALPSTTQPVAADLSLALSASTVENTSTSTVTATATAVDANRNALAGIPVTFSVDGNAVAVPGALVTNASGVVTAAIGIGGDFTNRTINVTATSGSITQSKPILVRGASLTASRSPVVNAGSVGNIIDFKLVDTNGRPMTAQPISVASTTLGTISGVTDINGAFFYTYNAPAQASTLAFSSSSAGAPLAFDVAVVVAGGVPVATQQPQGQSLSPSPSVVAVNSVGSVTNQSELRALFVGANNLPIPNIRVRFDLDGNVNSTDGTVSYPGEYAYSDASGVARGTFTPGQKSSPTDGVTVRACWDLTDFAAGTCPNQVTAKLTVATEALSVSIRTDNTVGQGAAGLTYIKRFVVMVVDAAGQAKPGVLITPSIDLPNYYKGEYRWNGLAWAKVLDLLIPGTDPQRFSWMPNTESYRYDTAAKAWVNQGPTTEPACPNEDANRNAVREAGTYVAGGAAPALAARQEDLNWNGDLDPRKADVAIRMVGSATTDTSGLAVVQIEYGKNLASWVDFIITVTASGIGGSEFKARYFGLNYGVGNLPGLAADVVVETVPPAFAISPYGRARVCTDPN